MNGIDPPTPMSIGSVPSQASVKAERAASYAGPVASIWVASPVSTTVWVSVAPHGVCASRCSTRRATAFSAVSPGAMRIEMRARAAGTRVLEAPATFGASRPVIERAGLVHSRSTAEPEPIHSRPGAAPDSARSRSSGYSTSAAGPLCSPLIATLPSSSCRLAITRLSAISESGTRPPHMPECTAWVSVRTSMSMRTRPRRLVVSAGTPMSQLPESAMTMTSARSDSWCSASSAGSVSEPTSSSPSMNITTLTGRSSPKTRTAPRWAAMPALSSAAPRA